MVVDFNGESVLLMNKRKTAGNHVFQVMLIKIWILNMEKEQIHTMDVESFSKANTFILVVIWMLQGFARLVQVELFNK